VCVCVCVCDNVYLKTILHELSFHIITHSLEFLLAFGL